MYATSTVSVQPSAGDFATAFATALATSVFELIVSAILESKWFHGLFSKMLGKLLARESIAAFMERLGKKVADDMQKRFAKILAKAIEDGIEDPMGHALKKIAYGAFEDLILEGPTRILINIVRGALGDPIKYGAGWLKDELVKLLDGE